jgi:hypothetical protein
VSLIDLYTFVLPVPLAGCEQQYLLAVPTLSGLLFFTHTSSHDYIPLQVGVSLRHLIFIRQHSKFRNTTFVRLCLLHAKF